MDRLFLDERARIITSTESYKLSSDVNSWPQEIVTKFLEAHPYLENYEVDISIESVDEDSKSLFGKIIISDEFKETAFVPVVVQNGRLKPLDIFIKNKKWYLLSPESLVEAFSSNVGTFGEAPTETEARGTGSSVEEAGQLWQMPSRFTAVKASSLLSLLDGTIPQTAINEFCKTAAEEGLFIAAHSNKALYSCLAKFAELTPYQEPELPRLAPTVMQVYRNQNQYYLRTASASGYAPEVHKLDYTEFDELPPAVKEAVVRFGYATFVPVPGKVEYKTDTYTELEKSGHAAEVVIPGKGKTKGIFLICVDPETGKVSKMLITDDGYAIQEKMVGIVKDKAKIKGTEPHGKGVFVVKQEESVKSYGPVTIKNKVKEGGFTKYAAVLADGKRVDIFMDESIKKPVLYQNLFALPADSVFVPLVGEQFNVVSSSRLLKEAQDYKYNTVNVSTDGHLWYLSGPPIEDIPENERKAVSRADAAFVLGCTGLDPAEIERVLTRTSETKQSSVVVPYEVQSYSAIVKWAEVTQEIDRDLYKQIGAIEYKPFLKLAKTLDHEKTLDTILSIGFLNPHNIRVFLNKIPILEEALSVLVQLLFAARVGLRFDEQDLKTCVVLLNDIIRKLKYIADNTVEVYDTSTET